MVDIASSIVTVLSNGWTAGNTDSVTPVIALKDSVNRIDLASTFVNNGDYVLVYDRQELDSENALGSTNRKVVYNASVDIRSASESDSVTIRAHAYKIKDEVLKILDAATGDPFGESDDKVLVASRVAYETIPLNNRRMYRFTIDVDVTDWNLDRNP